MECISFQKEGCEKNIWTGAELIAPDIMKLKQQLLSAAANLLAIW